MQLFAFLSLISSIIVLALGIFVYSQKRKSPLNQVFLFLCIMAFYWAFTESMLRDADSISSAYMWMKLTVLWTFIPAAALHFLLVFTKSGLLRRGRWTPVLIYAPAALFSIIELTTDQIITTPVLKYWGYTYGYSSYPLPPFLVEMVWMYGILVVSLIISLRYYFQVPGIREKNQTKYILTGISVVVIVTFVSQVVFPVFQITIPELETISFLFFSGMIGYAIQKHELFVVSPATAADNIVSTMTDSLILLDDSHTIISVNDATLRILRYEKEELIGRPFSAIFLSPSDSEAILSEIPGGTPVTDLEISYRSKEGITIPISFSGSVIKNVKGDSAGIVCISRDITWRKQIEEARREDEKRFRDLAEQFPELMFEADVHGIPTFINRHGYEILGYSDDDVRKGLTLFDLLVPEDREMGRQNYAKLLHGEIQRGNEYTALKKDGTQFPVILYSAPIVSFGKITGTRIFAGDIPEQKRADAALQQATRKLSLLTQITFNDIQNVIFSLEGYMRLATYIPADEKLEEYLEKESELVRKIAESLKFAKNYEDIGKKPAAWQNVSLSFLYGISHLDLSKVSRKLNVGELEIYADPLLEKVFFTIAENVVLHGKTVTEIALWYRETPEELTVVFEDNGTGISRELKERIFERRYEGKKGMSLFLVREILSITGITIAETGDPGKGARFEMTVPKGAYRFAGTPEKWVLTQ